MNLRRGRLLDVDIDTPFQAHAHKVGVRRTGSTSKAEINDLANLAFISDKANRKISARPPAVYFEELITADPGYLTDHFVPPEPELRAVEEYGAFIDRRRALLAEAMNALLQSHRPAFLDRARGVAAGGEEALLEIQAFGTSIDAGDIVLRFRATLGEASRDEAVPYAALAALIGDLEDGRGSELVVGEEYLAFDAEAEVVSVPLGPLAVTGTIPEWRKVLDRELADMKPADELSVEDGEPWEGVRSEFHVLESE